MGERRSHIVSCRLTDEEFARITAAAKRCRVSRSDMLRHRVLDTDLTAGVFQVPVGQITSVLGMTAAEVAADIERLHDSIDSMLGGVDVSELLSGGCRG